MKQTIYIIPKVSKQRQKVVLSDLNRYLNSKGIKSKIMLEEHEKGKLGGGIVGAVSALVAGNSGFMSKVGDTMLQYAVNKKTELTMKNENGQEISITSAMSHDQIADLIESFFGYKKNSIQRDSAKKKKTPNRKKTKKDNIKLLQKITKAKVEEQKKTKTTTSRTKKK